MNTGAGRRGRRTGAPDTRQGILAAARTLFARQGFEATSLREIARTAGVDPAMVHHYFDGKEDLFNSCVELPANPDEVFAGMAEVPAEERGEAILRTILGLWDSPAQPALLALLRGAATSQTTAALFRETVFRRILSKAMAGLPGDAAELRLRGTLVASQIMGLVMTRYLFRVEPLAHASTDQLAALAGPTIQRYLTGPLPG
ncbi:TetR family transcriptional regulator [Specibacter cremeus]|uniref:TetR/AcrR family transcriptional regulator n=1 Tax=Specibacter cremeus TaxID=1629051 RepID=UPI000F76DE07|nr:TetR family transcriptional regulator [Specibacter cremeus]